MSDLVIIVMAVAAVFAAGLSYGRVIRTKWECNFWDDVEALERLKHGPSNRPPVKQRRVDRPCPWCGDYH